MSIIPPKHVEPKETLSLRVECALCERLEQYAEFVKSPKNYVVTQALERIFRGDRKFVRWLATRPQPEARVGADGETQADETAKPPRAGGRSCP
jgi:hypothetical protein